MNKRILIGITIACAVLLGGFLYESHQTIPEVIESPRAISIMLEIRDVTEPNRIEIIEGTTVLEVLRSESIERGFTMRETEYAGLGTLVEQLGEFENGSDGRYWTYRVNGAFAPVGADVYEPVMGDDIKWTFDVPTETQ